MGNRIRMAAGAATALLALTLVVLNWKLFLGRAELNLIFGSLEAPIGLMIAVVTLAAAGLVFAVLGTRHALESRRFRKELTSLKAAADDQARTHSEALEQTVRAEVASIRARLDRIDRTFGGAETGS